jgi:type VI secretion system secreted protein VgrG
MPEYTQANRPLQLETPLGPDVLLLEGLTGEEGVSTTYAFTLDLLTTASIDPADLLRKPVVVTIVQPDGSERYLHGIVRRFTQGERSDDGFITCRAEVVPWLWFLSLSRDCRVYQNKTVLEIAELIFGELGYKDYRNDCLKQPPKREYCVQYRESHLDFISRLLEDEGIFYFFEHSDSKHVLVLADSPNAVVHGKGSKTARWLPGVGGAWPDDDVVRALEREFGVTPGQVTLTDYDYINPSLGLLRTVAGEQPEEVYDYPGGYTLPDEGERYARLQLEQREALMNVVRGTSNCRGFQSGCRFDLKDYYRADANVAYHLLQVRHQARVGGYRASYGQESFDYENSFVAIPHKVPYRPPAVTPRPVVQGSQTAVVVGPKGEEIHTDKHGRVKVQFHWDRLGKKDENSSCWVRVSVAWAGKGYGALTIPRIGQEVIVDFLEGNPDAPIITGRVYNAEQAPPYDPGKGGVVSGMRSNTHKGKGYNEMSMDDTAGKEMITIHAQYDMSTTVEHDDTQHIVQGNRKIDIDTGTHTEKIKGNTSITIVSGTYKLDVAANTHTHHVAKDVNETYDANQTTKVAHKISIDGGDEIFLKSGASSIKLEKGGTITIKCKNLVMIGDVDIKASAPKVEVTGGDEAKFGVGNQQMTCDKTKVNVSGAAINSSAVGMHEITGALVKIN